MTRLLRSRSDALEPHAHGLLSLCVNLRRDGGIQKRQLDEIAALADADADADAAAAAADLSFPCAARGLSELMSCACWSVWVKQNCAWASSESSHGRIRSWSASESAAASSMRSGMCAFDSRRSGSCGYKARRKRDARTFPSDTIGSSLLEAGAAPLSSWLTTPRCCAIDSASLGAVLNGPTSASQNLLRLHDWLHAALCAGVAHRTRCQ